MKVANVLQICRTNKLYRENLMLITLYIYIYNNRNIRQLRESEVRSQHCNKRDKAKKKRYQSHHNDELINVIGVL